MGILGLFRTCALKLTRIWAGEEISCLHLSFTRNKYFMKQCCLKLSKCYLNLIIIFLSKNSSKISVNLETVPHKIVIASSTTNNITHYIINYQSHHTLHQLQIINDNLFSCKHVAPYLVLTAEVA